MKAKNLLSRSLVITSIVSSIVLSPAISNAALLPAGTLIPAPFEPEPVGGLQLDQVVANYASADIQGTLISTVYSGDASNPWAGLGGLTFTYQIIASAASPEAIGDFTVGNFGGFQADASYDDIAVPGVAPNTVDRTLSGNVIGFGFFPGVLGGQDSALLVIQTDAEAYAPSLASLINATAETVPSLAPTPVPEPATFALMGLGVFAFILARKRG